MAYILDIIILAIVVFCIIRGAKRGAVRTAFSLLSFVVALVLTFMFASPLTQYIEQQPFGINMHDSIEQAIEVKINGILNRDAEETSNTTEDIIKSLSLPEFLKKSILMHSDFIVRNADVPAAKAVAGSLASAYLKMICSVALFIILLILLRILRLFCEQLFKLPILKEINRLVGGIAGFVNGIFIAYLLLSAVSALSGLPYFAWLAPAKESSYLFKYVYEYNILLSAFL